jgi:hypothetical protein
MGAAKTGGGWQESIDYHTAMTRGDDVIAQWMTEGGGWKKEWIGDTRGKVTVAVAAVETADVSAAVVVTETEMSRQG